MIITGSFFFFSLCVCVGGGVIFIDCSYELQLDSVWRF